MSEIIINKNNKSISFIHNNIAFSQFGVADKILDLITDLQNQLQQKENIVKELNDKIEDDKMIIEGNRNLIDNLRKDYNLQKNIIKEVREYIEEHTDKLKTTRIPKIDFNYKELLEILDKENNNE